MRVAVDLDGTLDSSEAVRTLVKKLHARGHKVSVLTGTHLPEVNKEARKLKKAKLKAIGMKGHYSKLKVYTNPPGKAKAKYCEKKKVSLMIDNSLSNANLAPGSTTVLVPWRTVTP